MMRTAAWRGLGLAVSLGLGLWACGSGGSTGTTGTGTGGASSTSSTSSTGTSTSTTTSGTTTTSTSTSTGSGGMDACPGCVVLAMLPVGSAPEGIAVDADNVYWTNAGTGEVMQAKKDGTGQVTLATEQGAPYSVFVSGGWVFWISYSGDGVMRKVPIGGGTVVDIISAPAARDLVVADNAVFWTRDPDDIEKVPVDGLPPGGATVLLSANTLANGITADASRVYWGNRQDGYVKSADFGLGNDTVIGAGDQPWDIVVDDVHAYWTERGSTPGVGKVTKASKLDGTGVVELATMQDGPRGIAMDKTHVYWANKEEGTIRRVPTAGGAVDTIASGQDNPVNIAVDDTSVYWTTSLGDTVMKAPKP